MNNNSFTVNAVWMNGDTADPYFKQLDAATREEAIAAFREWRKNNPSSDGWRRSAWLEINGKQIKTQPGAGGAGVSGRPSAMTKIVLAGRPYRPHFVLRMGIISPRNYCIWYAVKRDGIPAAQISRAFGMTRSNALSIVNRVSKWIKL